MSSFTSVARIGWLAATLMAFAPVAPPRYDTVIVGGRIVDGTGRPSSRADLAIKDGRIAAIGTVAASDGVRVIDARNLVVAPGFIDVHTHADDLAEHPAAANFVRMGVTTIVAGNCGTSASDIAEALAKIRDAAPSHQLRHARRAQHHSWNGHGIGRSTAHAPERWPG